MAVKIRLQRHGGKKRPFYFIVVASSSAPRDGKFIEKLGTYNPLTVPATIRLDRDKALTWLNEGAQPTNTVRRILSFKGVLFMKHLMRGVSLGLFTEEEAKVKFEEWNAEHEVLVVKRDEANRLHKQEKRKEADDASVKLIQDKTAAKVATATAEAEAAAAAAAPAEEEAPTEEAPTQEDAPATDATESTETPSAE